MATLIGRKRIKFGLIKLIDGATEHSKSVGQRAADLVADKIEAQIAAGMLEHNKPLPAERELMEEFKTSRTVIREAISKLANRGLLEAKPRFRPVVRKPDYGTVIEATGTIVRYMLNEPRGVLDLYQSRVFVERGLVRDAANNATKEDIAALKSALAENQRWIDDSNVFFRTDIAFHGVLYGMSGNPIFPALHKGYSAWLFPHWERMERSTEHNEINYLAHKAIYEAILERDPERAEEALIEHLRGAWEFVKDTFDNRENSTK